MVTELVQHLVTYRILPSPDTATLFGLLPLNPLLFAKVDFGAVVLISSMIWCVLVLITTIESLLDSATNSRVCGAFKVMRVGEPLRGMRPETTGKLVEISTTMISRSRALETNAVELP